LAACRDIKAVISQRLVRRADDKGRVPLCEIMIATGYIRDCIINADKTRLIQRRHRCRHQASTACRRSTNRSSTSYSKQLITLDELSRAPPNADEFKLRMTRASAPAPTPPARKWERQMADFERFARK